MPPLTIIEARLNRDVKLRQLNRAREQQTMADAQVRQLTEALEDAERKLDELEAE